MSWQADPEKHILEITRLFRDGRISTSSEEHQLGIEYAPGKHHSSKISLLLFGDETEIRIVPCTLEHFQLDVEEKFKITVITELFVGIRNRESIGYIGKIWTAEDSTKRYLGQVFFRDDRPVHYTLGWYPVLGHLIC